MGSETRRWGELKRFNDVCDKQEKVLFASQATMEFNSGSGALRGPILNYTYRHLRKPTKKAANLSGKGAVFHLDLPGDCERSP